MVLRAINRKEPHNPDPCDVLDTCPVCGGNMEEVYSRPHQKVCACQDCQTTITVTRCGLGHCTREEKDASATQISRPQGLRRVSPDSPLIPLIVARSS